LNTKKDRIQNCKQQTHKETIENNNQQQQSTLSSKWNVRPLGFSNRREFSKAKSRTLAKSGIFLALTGVILPHKPNSDSRDVREEQRNEEIYYFFCCFGSDCYGIILYFCETLSILLFIVSFAFFFFLKTKKN